MILENSGDIAQRIDQLSFLEYEIRRSITVREDQEEDALEWQLKEAERCGIILAPMATKGDLLSAVQTAVRAARSNIMRDKGM